MTSAGESRGWTILLIVLVAALPVGALLQPWLLPSRSEQPLIRRGVLAPVLLVTVPGLRAEHVGHLGGEVATPTLDRLAHEGVSFERFWTASNDRVATTAALLSSQPPSRTGVTGLDSTPPQNTMTLAGHLRTRGKATVAILGDPRLATPVLARHFETLVDTAKREDADALLTRGVDALIAQPDALVWVDVMVPGLLMTEQVSPEAVAELDAALGRALAALEDAMLLETLVLCVTGTGGGAGHDDDLFEASLEAPCLLRLPGQAVRGRRVTVAASSLDLAPTLGELVLKTPGSGSWPGQCGESLASFFTGGSGRLRILVAEGRHVPLAGAPARPSLAVRADRTKVILDASGQGTASLYDLGDDPDERLDLAPERPMVLDAMRNHLQSWFGACGGG
jgi:arylsulfatase A-like enzyme